MSSTTHEMTTILTTIGLQASVLEKSLPVLLEGYLAAIQAGLVPAYFPEKQLHYMGEIGSGLNEQVKRLRALIAAGSGML